MMDVTVRTGFGFFAIENLIPKFDQAYGGRFYAPHTLSFGLAPLVSPVKFDHLLYGLAHPDVELSLKVLREFDVENAMVVSSTHDNIHFLDEMGIYGVTRLIGMKQGMIGRLIQFDPTETLNLPRYTPKHIAQGKTKELNIRCSIKALRGIGEPAHEDIICINAGNLLYLANLVEDLREGYSNAKKALKHHWPLEKLEEFIQATNGNSKLLYRFQ
jgi:anthranilate phosphoribosyltransferase